MVVVHCKAGKGRTGMMICSLLVFLGMFSTHTEAIAHYNSQRAKNGKALTICSGITNKENGTCELDKPLVMIIDSKIESIRQIQTVLEIQIQSNIVFRLLAKSRYNVNVYKIQIFLLCVNRFFPTCGRLGSLCKDGILVIRLLHFT